MTSKTSKTSNTKANVNPTADGVGTDVVALFRKLQGKAIFYTDARNALIAREVILADNKRGTGAKLAKAFGIDKGDVSRIATIAMSLAPKGKVRMGLKSLSLAGIDVDNSNTVEALAAFGVAFRRTDKVNTPKVGTPNKDGASKDAPEQGTVTIVTSDGTVTAPDMLAALFDYLVADYAVRLPLVNAVLANAEAAAAAAAAEADAA
jgi:hypothetical protein